MNEKFPGQRACLQRQFKIAEMYVGYWQAMALTGACKSRKLSQGREATPEEQASGQCIGWRDLTDEEKVADALQIMQRHIHRMNELSDELAEIEQEKKEDGRNLPPGPCGDY